MTGERAGIKVSRLIPANVRESFPIPKRANFREKTS
jgi:hypothetical protein